MKGGVDEQGVETRARQSHEADRPILPIDGQPERTVWQELLDLRVDGLAVFRCEEMMGRIDRSAPDIDDPVAIIAPGRADFYVREWAGQQQEGGFHFQG